MLKPTPSTCLLLLVTQFSLHRRRGSDGRERVAVSDLGPFDQRFRKVFASGKSWQNLNPSDYRAVLIDIPNMNRVFIQEVSGVITFLIGFGAPKISGAFEKRALGRPGEALPYIRYIGMCRPKGYGF